MESLAQQPANAETALATTTEVDTEDSLATGDGSAPSATKVGAPETKVKDPVQERFDKLTRDKYDALREGDRTRYQLEQRDRELAELRAKLDARETTQVAPANDAPTLEQFGYDEGKYHAAVAAHFSKIAETQGRAAAEAYFKETQQRQQQENVTKSWATKEAEFMKSKPDYADKVKRDPRDGGPVISKPMADMIMDSQLGPQVAYYLAENVEKSLAIASLPPIEQAREIGRIEAKLELAKLPPAPVVSQAPPPVNKVDSNDAPAEKSPSDMTDTEFNKWRKKQIAARRNA